MEALGYVAILFFLGFTVWAFFLKSEADEVREEIAEMKASLPSKSELNKLKKAELVSLAEEHDIMVDMKSTKARIIEEIEKSK